MKRKFEEDLVLIPEIKCPCGEPLEIDIFERYTENNEPTPFGFTIMSCTGKEGKDCDEITKPGVLDEKYYKIQVLIKNEFKKPEKRL